jgi:hypothetical protein
LIKITSSKPTKPVVKDGVFEEPLKAPTQKQVWVLKPNHLKNPLDTLPNISEDPLPRAKKTPRVNHTHRRVSQQLPKREVRYHCDYCHMVTLLSFVLGGREMSGESTSRITGTCTTRPMAYMCRLFRGAVLGLEVQCLKVIGLRLRDHAMVMPSVVQVMVNMALNPMVVALVFGPIALVDHVFSHVVFAFLKWDMVCLVFFLTLF